MFCKVESELLCIDCILGDHKNHEIISVEAASANEKDLLTLKF